MYDKINITENTLQVISLFTDGFNREYYIREVEKLLNISPRTAQLMLEGLENKGILESKMRGKIKLYKLKFNWSSKKYLIFTEQYKEIAFMEKNILIKEIIEKISPDIKGIGLIFGSYVKGTYDKDSDLDIFIAGTYDKEKIKKISKMYGIEISVKCYPIGTFEKNINEDILLKEILKNHIVFLNAEHFVQAVVRNR
ncbi:MAG: nucleotidyltransferase domain-containing protein [Candidatus Aenigmarchaeota archaeon]|nr:nucleotidyltransferase domain-containing protein [Candidatus Aenigmarchaeota archaeon]